MRSIFSPSLVLIFVLAAAMVSSAGTITSSSGALTATVDASGAYSLAASSPGWQFSGSLPSPAHEVAVSKGQDAVGSYQQISFTFQDAAHPMNGFIRLYDSNDLVLFSQTVLQASAAPPLPFPNFTTLPHDLFSFSYTDRAFAPPKFELEKNSQPGLLFDRQDNALIISPASHFICSRLVGDGTTQIGSGFYPDLKNIPANFTQQTLVALTHGINHAWDIWGNALTDLQGKKRPANDADIILKYYGYWTDNGAAYWYNYDLAKGYQGTLQAVVDSYRSEKIPLHYLQLDSWWYHKTLTGADGKQQKPKNPKLPEGDWNRYGGTVEYKAHPFVFPKGMEAFHQATGLPFVTHNRWIDPTSPYHERYKISGIAAVDRGFWDEIATYLKDNGVIAYEQDWLVSILANSPELSSTVDLGDAFFDGMANACKAQGLSVQYCMGTPRCFLEGSRYDNLTTIRVSGDRFEARKYHDFLYTSRLAESLGIWPWVDVFKSTEVDNLLLSTLSAGPVGTGDALGKENRDNILKAMRADGVIIKPDVPLTPIDSAYINEAQDADVPLLATTYTNHDGLKIIYGVALARPQSAATTVTIDPAELGCKGPVYLYDYFAGTGQKLDKRSPVSTGLIAPLAYFIASPITRCGIAFLGDADKFVGTGKKRILSLHDDDSHLTAEILLAANEDAVTLKGYAPQAPEVSVQGGHNRPVQYDPATGLFTVTVEPDMSIAPETIDGDATRKITVAFQTK